MSETTCLNGAGFGSLVCGITECVQRGHCLRASSALECHTLSRPIAIKMVAERLLYLAEQKEKYLEANVNHS